MPSTWNHIISAIPAAAAGGSTPPVSLSIVLGAACCAVGLLAGVLGLGIWVAMRRRRSDEGPRGK